MPIYEYECSDCSCRFDIKRSFTDESLVSCPQCGSDARRIFSPSIIIFKGSGFYTTDYRGGHSHSQPVRSSGEAEDGASDKTGAGSAGEAKTASIGDDN